MTKRLRVAILVALIGGLMVLVAVLFGGQKQLGSVGTFPSSYNRTPSGLLGLHRFLTRRGTPPVARLDRPWDELAGTGNVLLVAEPLQLAPTAEEAQALIAWVRRGNTLVYCAGLDEARPGGNAPLDRQLGITARPRPPAPTVEDLISGVRTLAAVPQVLRVAAPSPLTVGVRGVATLAARPLPADMVAVPILEDNAGGAHLVYRNEDAGSVYVASSPSFFSNELVTRSDNLVLFDNLLGHIGDGGQLLFDEYHHGYAEAPPLTTPYARRVFAALAVQVAILGLAFLVSRGRRFGPLKGHSRMQRRSSLEFVDALAELYRRGRAGSHAAARLYDDFREQMSRDLRLPKLATAEQLAAALARRTQRRHSSIYRDLCAAEQAAAGGEVAPRRLLAVARNLAELKKEVISS